MGVMNRIVVISVLHHVHKLYHFQGISILLWHYKWNFVFNIPYIMDGGKRSDDKYCEIL